MDKKKRSQTKPINKSKGMKKKQESVEDTADQFRSEREREREKSNEFD